MILILRGEFCQHIYFVALGKWFDKFDNAT